MKPLFFVLFLVVLMVACNAQPEQEAIKSQQIYVCLPCGSDCDTTQYKIPGTCSHCKMELVKKSKIAHSNIEPEDLCSFIIKAGNNNVLLLDVRTPDEFEGRSEEKFGRLNHAINIPVQELEKRVGELAAYKNKQIIVYCSHSHRSPRASYILSQNGFKVTNMLGGMSVWKASVKNEECNKILFISQ
ncbi:MAG TPA: rhodanese-like domain-containing protein [Chitinophagaceae bacterium]|nr:rhodanese-like domain-containing protein [Chitinophagaceae bacterium]